LAWGAGPYNTTMKMGCEEGDDRNSYKKKYFQLFICAVEEKRGPKANYLA